MQSTSWPGICRSKASNYRQMLINGWLNVEPLKRNIQPLEKRLFYGHSMNIHHSIAQVFENNMGNRITPELAGGMIRSLIDILATGVQQAGDSQQQTEPASEAQLQEEGSNGMV
ncbi:hypothetical protein NBV64_07695 [Alcaligenes sp. DN25]|uniref:hypothetical protein n=1 Tax=Alcaligenes TaxID=507 RepID=UPI00202E0997|nr:MULTISPECIES: hypothetical protein [Alcaligenes]URW84215.1 hypothetical protein NBV64_07695 [Alcaligenes sp. DN25]WEA69055.1 hypothetical protein PWH35_07715 [Alcaligenes faecalis]